MAIYGGIEMKGQMSKRFNMFSSSGNKENIKGRGNVLPFEVLGKWMGRYAMWQLDYANDLFIGNGSALGKSEISYDVDAEIWEYDSEDEHDADDDQYCSEKSDSADDESDSDLEPFSPEDDEQCIFVGFSDARYGLRERPVCVE